MGTIMGGLETFNPKLGAQSCLRTRLYKQNFFRVEARATRLAELPCASQLFLYFLTKLGTPFT